MTKFFIDQHGCAKNQVDGELLINKLIQSGLKQTFEADEADFIIVNSCGFIESAKKESLDAVYSARKNFPHAKILLTGCLAERYANDLKEALPEADAIFGNGNLSKITETVNKMLSGSRPVEVYAQEGVCSGDRTVMLSYRGSAFVKITEGCSNHCSFCAIPLIRGELRSRNALSIVQEIKTLVKRGVVEFNLIGQDLAAYGTGIPDVDENGNPIVFADTQENEEDKKLSPLARLFSLISKIEGKFIVRPLYIHPDHFNLDILKVMKKDSRFLPYFDIPFQSGDDEIIKKMNRKGTSKSYMSLIDSIRKEFPNAVIRTTFLAGFPGETEEAALHTEQFLTAIKSDRSGCFPYSLEEDTPAYKMKNKVPKKIAKQRSGRLCKIQAELTKKSLQAKIGLEYDVLIEEIVEGSEGLAIGRAWFQAPEVDGDVVVQYEKELGCEKDFVKPGRFVRVKILSSTEVDLAGIFVSDSALNLKKPKESDSPLLYAPELQEN